VVHYTYNFPWESLKYCSILYIIVFGGIIFFLTLGLFGFNLVPLTSLFSVLVIVIAVHFKPSNQWRSLEGIFISGMRLAK